MKHQHPSIAQRLLGVLGLVLAVASSPAYAAEDYSCLHSTAYKLTVSNQNIVTQFCIYAINAWGVDAGYFQETNLDEAQLVAVVAKHHHLASDINSHAGNEDVKFAPGHHQVSFLQQSKIEADDFRLSEQGVIIFRIYKVEAGADNVRKSSPATLGQARLKQISITVGDSTPVVKQLSSKELDTNSALIPVAEYLKANLAGKPIFITMTQTLMREELISKVTEVNNELKWQSWFKPVDGPLISYRLAITGMSVVDGSFQVIPAAVFLGYRHFIRPSNLPNELCSVCDLTVGAYAGPLILKDKETTDFTVAGIHGSVGVGLAGFEVAIGANFEPGASTEKRITPVLSISMSELLLRTLKVK